MKKLLYFLPFFYPYFSFGQTIIKSDSTVFKQCNAIVIITNKTAEELYKLSGNQLIADGFIIENANRDFLTLNTKEINGPFLRRLTMSLTIIENKIKLRGFLTSSESNLIIPAVYPNGNFKYLQKFAIHLAEKGAGKILYLQEKYDLLEN